MNDEAQHQPLLNDVLAESSPPGFRDALLAETLRVARRRRLRRRLRPFAAVFMISLLSFWAWTNRPGNSLVSQAPPKPGLARSYVLVETRPFAALANATAGNFAPVRVVSSAATIPIIATRSGEFRYVNDVQLLALLSPQAAILVRTGPDSEQLVFAGP